MAEPEEIQVVIPTWWRPTFDAAVAVLGLELYAIPSRADDLPTYSVRFTDTTITEAVQTLQAKDCCCHEPAHKIGGCHACVYLKCGCLSNNADAHRVGCPDYPEGRRGA